MRCLAKNPDDRWPTGRSLREAILPGAPGMAVPEHLDELDGVGFWAVATGLGVAYVAWLERFWRGHLEPTLELAVWLLPLALPTLFAARFVVQARTARHHGHSQREILRAAFWPPDGWPFYPARWRRPGDVWPRLPVVARLLRTLMAGAILVVGLVFLPAAFIILSPFYWEDSRSSHLIFDLAAGLSLLGFVVLLASIPLAFVAGNWWARRHGLAGADRYRMFFGATKSSTFWKRPHIAALLKPADAPSASLTGPTQDVTDSPTSTR